ncbi:response regulator [Candidatus Roizmanbacteria bacterium]|nr:response regulator [Candidatus Roizmanbacteria bacterium]
MDNKRILLVEDDPLLLKLYTDLLTGENFFVESASDGLTAYQKMKQGGWDLVLLDILLPELGGIEIVKKLKDDQEAKPNKKIVFLTNLDQGKEIDEIKKLGFEYIIKSSLNPDELVNKIKAYLA